MSGWPPTTRTHIGGTSGGRPITSRPTLSSLKSGRSLASSVPSDKPALRVLHVTSMFPTAAQPSAGSYVETLVRGLETLRVRQEVMAIPYGGPKGKYWRVARQIRELAQRDRFDLVHAHYGLAGWAAMWHSLP